MSSSLQGQPEAGHTPAEPGWKEAMAATTREAVAEFGSELDENAEDTDSAEPAPEAEGEAVGDEPAQQSKDEDSEAGDSQQPEKKTGTEPAWDGNPANIPESVRPGVEAFMANVYRGVNKRLRELADKERMMNDTIMRYQHAAAQNLQPQGKPEAQPAGPPPKPGADASEAEWDAYYDARGEWVAQQAMEKAIREGRLVTADRHQETESIVKQQQLLNEITSWPGATSEVLQRMAKMSESNERLAALLDDREGAATLFALAKRDVELESAARARAEQQQADALKANEEAKRRAGAAKAGIPRPGGSSNVGNEEAALKARQQGMSTQERLAVIAKSVEREALSRR